MAVDIDIVYTGGLHCEATHRPSGSKLVTDAPLDNGGKGEAFSPTDLCATSLGSCLVTTMALVATRHGIELAGTTVHVVKEMVADPRRRIASLPTTVTFPTSLATLPAEKKALLEATARACPVTQSLGPNVEVPMTFVWPG
ncbi:MAG TPA: OsmC family protein [Thermoanaerobaculia bacterium]|nr:OsmC family protein [Thermoanaerobaculia bacterium]